MSYRKNRLAHLLTNWRPPAGLRATRPRDVTYTGSGWVVAACMWAAFLGAFAAIVLLGEKADREAAEARLLEQQGAETTGHITRLWRGRGDSKQPYAAFEFTAGGRKFTGRVKVRLSVWRHLSLGDRWNIRYVPSNPRIHHPVQYPPNVTPAVVPYLIGSVCFGLAALLWGLLRREKYLLAEGRIAPGVITGVKEAHGHKHAYRYEFPLLSGGVGQGKMYPTHNAHFVGEKVCVVYLPDNPDRNALYPLSMVRQAGHFVTEKRKPRSARRFPVTSKHLTA